MNDFIVDAALLACPPPQGTSDQYISQLIDFLERLTDISVLRKSLPCTRFWRQQDLERVLVDNNAYPFRHALQAATKYIEPELFFQVEDASSLVMSLLQRSASLEEASQIREIIIGKLEITNDPVSSRDVGMAEQLCASLELACHCLGDGSSIDDRATVLSKADPLRDLPLIAHYEIEILERFNGDVIGPINDRNATVSKYCTAESYLRKLDPVIIWSSRLPDHLIAACAISAAQNAVDFWATMDLINERMEVGKDFIASALPLGFMHDPTKIKRVLRACSDLIQNVNLRATHELRTGAGGNAPQRIKDGWAAWRLDIDDEFHLHYWKKASDIRIANLVVHNNFDIS